MEAGRGAGRVAVKTQGEGCFFCFFFLILHLRLAAELLAAEFNNSEETLDVSHSVLSGAADNSQQMYLHP